MSSSFSLPGPLNVMNLRDHIEQQLHKAMVNGVIKPGDRLVESTIADQLGVSRAPVREALAGLERDGVVVHIPRRGYFVVEFTDKDVEEIYSLRLVLEREALRRAVGRFTKEHLIEMECLIDDLGEAARQQSDPVRIVELDLLFHE